MEKDQFIKDWLEGKVSSKELDDAKKEDSTISDFEKIISESKKLKVPKGKTTEQAWNDFVTKIDQKETPKGKVRQFSPMWAVGIAAALALAIAAYIFLFNSTTIATTPGNRLAYTLPDGSEVTLNADSKIAFSKLNWENNRTVKLEGEAFFKVKKGSTFKVEGERASITVLGTSFNVFMRAKTIKVQCFTGRVNVESKNKAVVLEKGQATDDDFEAIPFDTDTHATWRTGEFYYQNHPLSSVIGEIERQYDVKIIYESSKTRMYTGYFHDQNLEETLQLVFKPMGLNYSIEGSKIIVK